MTHSLSPNTARTRAPRLVASGLLACGALLATAPLASAATAPVDTASQGFLAIIPGGNGTGTITSDPAGIDCTITPDGTLGTCQSFFPAGTVVKLKVDPDQGSRFQGWRGTPGCTKAPKVTIVADVSIFCQPGIMLKL